MPITKTFPLPALTDVRDDIAPRTGDVLTWQLTEWIASPGTAEALLPTTINVVLDGGGAPVTTGVKADVSIPYAGTITGVRLLADVSGSLVLDLWRDTYANYPPTGADSICGGSKPTLSAAIKSDDTTLTGWSPNVAAGDIIRVNVESATTLQRVTLAITITRSA